jgi:hypothetical protein
VEAEAEAVLPAEGSAVGQHPPEPPRVSPGPGRALVQECHETFEDIAVATLMMITSSSSAVFMIRSFTPTTATTRILTAIRTGITPTGAAMDTILIINPVTAALPAVCRFGKSKFVCRVPAFTTDGLTE